LEVATAPDTTSPPTLKFVRPKPTEWAIIAGGLVLCVVYFWFLDDAFVYFRHVDNFLILKIGLVYNAGEYVEGFSSPVWTVLLILLRTTGASYPAIAIAVAFLGYLLFAFLAIAINRALSPRGVVVNIPLAFLGLSYGVLTYFTSGLETPLVLVSALVYAVYVLKPESRSLQVVMGVTPLVRHELALPLLIALAWGWWRTRRPPLALMASTAVTCGAWGLVRVVYYAEILPNTFYLKNMWMPRQGLTYLYDTVVTYHLDALAIVFLVLALWLRRAGAELRLAERGIMLLMAVSVTLYVIKIGGDPRHFRYLAFPFCLAVAACAGLVEHAWIRKLPNIDRRWASALGLAVALWSFAHYPRQVARHPAFFVANNRHQQVDLINDAFGHRRLRALTSEAWSQRASPDAMRAYREAHSPFVYQGVEVEGWCADGYATFHKRVVHAGGLTDAILARTDVPAQRAAHKAGLKPLAVDIARVLRGARTLEPGMYRRRVEQGRAPEWIRNNLETIEVIERKIYNRHRLWENLRLSLTFPDRIDPGAVPGSDTNEPR
jgi:hypothetical protein